MKTLLLIDAHSLIHRAFHALPPLTSPAGRAAGALYGLASILIRLWKDDPPDYAAALFDRPEKTFRKEKFEAYKAHRPPAPRELIEQLQEARTVFQKFGITSFEKAGFEADDLIATLAETFGGTRELRVLILTGDKDTLQLVRGNKVVVRTFRKGVSDTFIYDENAVREKYGLGPEQMTDYKALVGDPSDNIKGVPGVGEKTAVSYLKKYGNIENLFEHAENDPKIKARLAGQRRAAEESKELVILRRDVPMGTIVLDDLVPQKNTAGLAAYLTELGFTSLLRRLGGENTAMNAETSSRPSLFPNQKRAPAKSDMVLLRSGEAVVDSDAREEGKLKVGFGLKEILRHAWESGKDIAPPYADLGVAYWLLDPDFKKYDAPSIAGKFLDREWSGSDDDFRRAYSYALQKLREYSLVGIFEDIEMPVLRILAEMERTGIRIHSEKLASLEMTIDRALLGLTDKIYEYAGGEFNVNSPQQLSAILFDKLKLGGRVVRKTATGRVSTSAETLEGLREEHPIVGLILKYREDFKIQSTYVRALREHTGKDGRLHTDFIQTGTATGRLSSQSPNVQNIPRESSWSDQLRSAFEASPGMSLVSFDYSQIELRILSALSNDEKMKTAFENGEDIHRITAARIFNVPVSSVQPEMRRLAKTLNFGLIYGMGASAFARTSGLTRAKAQEFIGTYFREFYRVREWQDTILKDARATGFVQTMLGRRRFLPDLTSRSPRLSAEAERAAINHPIQGTNADINKLAMVRAKKSLEEASLWGGDVKMLLAIHDELLFEVRDSIINKTARTVREVMERAYDIGVPLRVDVAYGKTWGSMKPLSRSAAEDHDE